ncbi:MAG: protein rep [Planctomycetes bacterium]|nr:protein rep [Planctomycetota bacterium]
MESKFDGDIFDDPRMIAARNRVILALENSPAPYSKRFRAKLNGLRQCGVYPVALILSQGRVSRVLRNQCGNRGCPVCDSLRAARIRRGLGEVVAERMKAGARFSLITLTMPHRRGDMAQKLVCHLTAGLRKFQQTEGFKQNVRSWARGIEVPWSAANGFHPHAHYIVEAKIWPKEEIKQVWIECMARAGGPAVLPNGAHVKGVKDAGKGLMEAVGYPFKIMDLNSIPFLELVELLYATRNRRLVSMCRTWSGRIKHLLEDRAAEAAGLDLADGVDCVSFGEVRLRARTGDRAALRLMVEAAELLERSAGTRSLAQGLWLMLKGEVGPCTPDVASKGVGGREGEY